MSYKLTSMGVVRQSDKACLSPNHPDYQVYLDWVNAGNTPIPEYTTTEIKEQQWSAIKAKRDAVSSHSVYAAGGWYDSDIKSRTQQIGLVMMGAAIPAIQWKRKDGSFVTMTQALAGAIFQATAARDQACFATAEAHRIAMEASPNPAAYDFSTGWVASYSA